MKISMVSCNLSENPMIRVYPFAKILSKHFDVEIIGPISKKGLYAPLEGEGFKIKSVKERRFYPNYLRTYRELIKCCTGDVIHAFKPRVYSYKVALFKKKHENKKIILDIDDWESRYMIDNFVSNPLDYVKIILGDLYIPEGYLSKKFLEKQIKKADGIITSSKGLQKLFGGTCIHSCADTHHFDPKKYSGEEVREKLNINKDEIIVSFIGIPKEHKGVEEIIKAVNLARKENEKIKFLIVGASDTNPCVLKLKRMVQKNNFKDFVILEGLKPYKDVPYYAAATDIFAIPQRDTPSANAQMPYKVLNCMAMGRPIISTKTMDIAETLSGCGAIVEPGNILGLKQAILKYANNSKLRKLHGINARKKSIEKYSWEVMEKQTLKAYQDAGII